MNKEHKISKKENKRKISFKSLGRLLSYLFDYKWQMALIIICVIVSSITQIIGVNMLQPIIDNYILKDDIMGLRAACMNMALIYGVSAGTSFIYSRMMVRVGERSIRNIRDDLFKRIQTMPIDFFDSNPHGEIMSRFTNDTDVLSQALANTVPTIIRSLLMFVGTLIAMIRLDLTLTGLLILGLFVMIPVLSRIIMNSGRFFAAAQKSVSVLHGYNEEILSGQKVVKVFNREKYAKEGFEERSENLRASFAQANINAGRMMPFLINSVNIIYALITALGVYQTITGALSVGTLAAFLSNIRQIQNPITNVSQQANSIFSALAGADRIFELIDMPEEKETGYIKLIYAAVTKDGEIIECDDLSGRYAWKIKDKNGEISYKLLEGRIEFKNVDFSYDGKNQILKDISFYANPGEKIAFVGSTGAGKTTITNVITRFYEIDSGEITIDDINIRDIEKDSLRRAFGTVLQDVNLFTDTIEGNIRFGRLSAGLEEIKSAARLSGADSFIKRLPEKYETEIKGDGSSLSDGQNQLISISRAAIAEAPMLILDEATSSIDTATEIKVTEAMDNLMQGSTSIVIAHRLSTIQNADVIMVMEDGRIIERGNHEKLMAERGTYWQLYTGQLELD